MNGFQPPFDRNAKIDNALSAQELGQLCDWYWKHYGLEIPWLGDVQIMQTGIVEPHEEHRRNFYVRVMSNGPVGFDKTKALATVSYRLAHGEEESFDLEAQYRLDRSSAYKTRISNIAGKFVIGSARVLNKNGPRLLELHSLFEKLDQETSTLSGWAGSGRPMFVTCQNFKCQNFKISSFFDSKVVHKWYAQHDTLDRLKTLLKCSKCGEKHHKLTCYGFAQK